MKHFFTAVFILFTLNIFAQDTIPSYGKDSAPHFPGGDKAMFKFFKKNINYPKALKNSIVYVSFVVDKEGNRTDEWIVLGISPEVDAEVMRVIKLMPKWKPEYINGKPTYCQIKLPVVLR